MPEGSTSSMPMDIHQAQALVEYVENPQNTVGVGLLSWALLSGQDPSYCRAICRYQKKLATPTSMRIRVR